MVEEFSIRLATKDDIKNVFDLSNDDTVRANSINQEKIKWEDHVEWFAKKIIDKNSVFYVAYNKEDFVGYCRLDKNEDDEWIVTIHLNSNFRNKGFGKRLLDYVCKNNAQKKLVAEIKTDNISSYKLFSFFKFEYFQCKNYNNQTIVFKLAKQGRKKNILISPIGGQAIYGIIEYYKEKGYKIIGIDGNDNSIGKNFVDKFYKAPLVSSSEYKDFILSIIKNENIDLYISWLDSEILFWNKHKNEIPKCLMNKFYINFMNNYEKIYNKKLFYQELITQKIVCPKFIYNNTGFPILAKPIYGSGSKGIRLLENSTEFVNIKNKEEYVFQEYIEGKEYTVDFIAKNGELINQVVRIRNKSQGICLDGEITFNNNICEILKDFCKKFNINGLNNIQFIEKEKTYYIIDFNPRPSGTIMLSIKSGVDLLKNYQELLESKPFTEYPQPKKLKMIRYYKEYYYV